MEDLNMTDMAQGAFHLKSAVFTVGRSFPVYPDEQTFSEPVGMS
jgi:hypothetical protein